MESGAASAVTTGTRTMPSWSVACSDTPGMYVFNIHVVLYVLYICDVTIVFILGSLYLFNENF